MYEQDNFGVGYALGRDSSNNGNDGMFGGGAWAWWIIILLIFGWGGFGNGFGGFGGGGSMLNGILTRGDLCQDMNFNDLQNGVRGVSDAVNLGFANLNSTICAQQYDTAQMINAMNITNLQSANALQSQLASCCCDIERGIERLGCQSASETAAIIQAGSANTQRILDYLCNEKIEALRAENTLLTSQLSQNAQTRTIIDTLLPVAKPAYITCSPYQSAFGYPFAGQYGFGGCGCGTAF